jgi:hypothetical protein
LTGQQWSTREQKGKNNCGFHDCVSKMAYPVEKCHTLVAGFSMHKPKRFRAARDEQLWAFRVSFLNNPQSDNFPLVMQTRRAFEPAPAFSRAIVPLSR